MSTVLDMYRVLYKIPLKLLCTAVLQAGAHYSTTLTNKEWSCPQSSGPVAKILQNPVLIRLSGYYRTHLQSTALEMENVCNRMKKPLASDSQQPYRVVLASPLKCAEPGKSRHYCMHSVLLELMLDAWSEC